MVVPGGNTLTELLPALATKRLPRLSNARLVGPSSPLIVAPALEAPGAYTLIVLPLMSVT